MHSDDMRRHALRSLRLVQAQGWDNETLMRDYATEALVAAGVPRERSRDVVARVWFDNFRVTGPN